MDILYKDEESIPLLPSASTDKPGSEKFNRLRWRSILIAYFVTLTVCMQPSVYSSSLYQFMTILDPQTTSQFYGYAVMAFYVASACSSLIYGILSNYLRQTKIFILTALLFSTIGSLLLFISPTFSADQRVVILIGRVLSGLGFGILGVVSAFVIMESYDDERTFAVSSKCAVSSIAAIFGPLVLLAFYITGDDFHGQSIVINVFTGPALVFAACTFVEMFVVLRYFSESWVAVERLEHRRKLMERKESAFAPLPNYDTVAAVILIVLHAIFEFVKSYMDSVQSPSTIAMFGWTSKEAVLYNGVISLVAAGIAVFGNVLDGNVIMKYIRERQIMLFCFVSLVVFYAISFPSRKFPKVYKTCTFAWCKGGRTTTLTGYLIGYVFLALGYGFSVVPNCILFSRAIGPRKQGTMQGIYNGAAEFVLIVSPISNSFLTNFGPQAVWICGLVVVFVGIFVLLAAYQRLVPFRR